MKKILCPTDFTDTADNAIVYAAKLAKKINAGLTLINVQVLSELTVEQAVWGKDMNVQAAQARLESQSEEVTKVFKIPCGFDVETATLSLSHVISNRALAYDLIVMGTEGTSTISQFFTGTHTYNVIRETQVPVLLVPTEAGYSEIKEIVFAFDYLHFKQLPLVQLMKFHHAVDSKLTILQVMKTPYEREAEVALEEIQNQVKQFYPEEEDAICFDTIYTEADELASSIHSYMIRNNADLLALCSIHHKFSEKIFHKSVIKTITGIASYPVFVFH